MGENSGTQSNDAVDIVVVGGGQAGLAVGYYLRAHGLDFVILDAGPEVGHVWRSRWDSLRLFTPAQYSRLPGLLFPAPADTYPARDQVADYLVDYAARFKLPIQLNSEVVGLSRDQGGLFTVESTSGRYRTRSVVMATGPFSQPFVPSLAAGLTPELPQLHTAHYRSPDQLPAGRVLVVGGGNSGFQIAAELAEAGHAVELSEGRRNACVPQRLLGRDLFWWQDKTGVIRVTADSRFGRLMAANDGTVIGSTRAGLRRLGVTFRPRATSANATSVTFENGESTEIDAVVWATGFRIDDSWIRIPEALDEYGRLVQRRGVVQGVPGMFTIGRPWQHTTGSALLGFVQYDAKWIVDRIPVSRADG